MVHIHKADCCTVYTLNTSNELGAQPRALPWRQTLPVLGRGRAALPQPPCPGQLCPPLTHLLPTAALPTTQHSLRRMRSSSPAEAAQELGGSNPSPSKVGSALPAPAPPGQPGRGHTYTHCCARWSLLASPFLPAQLLPPRGAKRVPLVLLLSAGCGQQWGREVSCKFCSSCVLQSVSHADRTGRRSHTESCHSL